MGDSDSSFVSPLHLSLSGCYIAIIEGKMSDIDIIARAGDVNLITECRPLGGKLSKPWGGRDVTSQTKALCRGLVDRQSLLQMGDTMT